MNTKFYDFEANHKITEELENYKKTMHDLLEKFQAEKYIIKTKVRRS